MIILDSGLLFWGHFVNIGAKDILLFIACKIFYVEFISLKILKTCLVTINWKFFFAILVSLVY